MGGGRRGGALIHTRFSPQQRQEIGLPEVEGDCSTGNGRRLLYRKWQEIALPEVAGDCSTGNGRRLAQFKWQDSILLEATGG